MSGEMGSAINWGTFWVDSGRRDKDGDVIGKQVKYPLPKGGVEEIRERLVEIAAETLPPGTRYEIRRSIPANRGLGHGMAWYRHPDMDEAKEWGATFESEEGGLRPKKGYSLVGEFVTP